MNNKIKPSLKNAVDLNHYGKVLELFSSASVVCWQLSVIIREVFGFHYSKLKSKALQSTYKQIRIRSEMK